MKAAREEWILAVFIGALTVAACAGAPAPTSDGTPAVTLDVIAEARAFRHETLSVPAGSPFAIRFENRDTLPHNIDVHGPSRMASEIFSGPASRIAVFGALPAGIYTFICDVHPDMVGTIVSR